MTANSQDPNRKLRFDFSLISKVGNYRQNNQDSGLASSIMLVVADGMGGHAGGDVASSLTIEALAHLSTTGSRPLKDSRGAVEELEISVTNALTSIIDKSEQFPSLRGMGTTLSAAYLTKDGIVTCHLGDSRAYLLRNGRLTRVTKDHTFVQGLVDSGRITEQQAMFHPQRNVVTKVLGDFEMDLTPDYSVQECLEGDRWFLCSDGVCGSLEDGYIERVLKETPDCKEAASRLIEESLTAGSTDNVTAIVADVTYLQKAKRRSVAGAAKTYFLNKEDFRQAFQIEGTPAESSGHDLLPGEAGLGSDAGQAAARSADKSDPITSTEIPTVSGQIPEVASRQNNAEAGATNSDSDTIFSRLKRIFSFKSSQ